jgi:hypothetical protein
LHSVGTLAFQPALSPSEIRIPSMSQILLYAI